MNFLPKGRTVIWVVSSGLACILVLLAIMQYRWSREVSEATSTRMLSSLRGAMMNFRQDLSRQLGLMCLELEPEASKPSPDARRLTHAMGSWESTNSLSNLVSNLYLVKSAEDERISLFHLLPAQGRLALVAWPPRLAKIRALIAADSASLHPQRSDTERSDRESSDRADQPPRDKRGPSRGLRIGAIDESIPMLVVPIGQNSHRSWLLLEIDQHVLAQSVYPQLAQHYFGESPDYDIAVIENDNENDNSGSPSKVFYSSNEGFGVEGLAGADATLNLFGPPSISKKTGEPPVEDLFPGSLMGKENAARELSNATGGMFGPIRFDPIPSGAEDPKWRIVARHRKGSVEAAVAELRRRNLEISFGVLLILATSLALILLTSQRAHRLATLQMDFVAGVSHELRTPVAAILSISDNLVDGIVDDRQQLERYGKLIRNQARQLNHLVEQVLRFSAARKATTSYTVRPVDIAEVVEAALENTFNLLTVSGFKVEQRIEPGLTPVDADFGALSQCLQNLITNAIKYGGDHRWIGIEARQANGEVLLTVKDRGIGIENQELKHIFEPFYRSPKVAETQIHGTGLGLALAKSFAEAMGGRLTVHSVLGEGSAFTIHLHQGTRPTELHSIDHADVHE
jgi:signal transduction histidine kinase